jgi:GAF domain-containing protein
MTERETADVMADVSTELHEQPDEEITTLLIVERARDLIDGAGHASLTVRAKRGHTTLAATSALAEELDRLQYVHDEGPCVESADRGEWFRAGDVAHDPRWPTWGPQAYALGARSLLSVRLLSKGKPFGALNLYSEQTGAFGDPAQVDFALLFAIHAANALVAARQVTNLETALSSRHDIGLAQGILMARYGLTVDQSFAALQRVSQAENVKLRDVALDVVRTGALPSMSATPLA